MQRVACAALTPTAPAAPRWRPLAARRGGLLALPGRRSSSSNGGGGGGLSNTAWWEVVCIVRHIRHRCACLHGRQAC